MDGPRSPGKLAKLKRLIRKIIKEHGKRKAAS